jgi:TonB-linked SusC/RagA family outer membrane protein
MIKRNEKWVLLMMIFSISFTLSAQKKTIVGIVTDQTKEPLAGVSVKVKGTQDGTITDFNGRYSVKADANSTIVFSFIGMQTVEVKAANRTVVNAVLEDRAFQLNEAVAVGYGSVKRKDLTGSVGKVDMQEMGLAPVPNLDQALSGRIAGLNIISPDGSPDGIAQVTIRGGTLSQDAAPLFIIDGFPMENFDMKSLDPKSIESIEVLKDASSIAIYGSRGANGVIIITSKKGLIGKPRLSYNFSYSLNLKPALIPMMNPYDYVNLQLQLANLDNTGTSSNGNNSLDMFLGPIDPITKMRPRTLDYYKNQAGINWLDMIMQNSPTQTHNINFSGGNEDTKYNITASYVDQAGIVINTGMKKYSAKANIEQKLTPDLKIILEASTNTTTTLTNTAITNARQFRPTTGYKEFDIIGSAIDSAALNNSTYTIDIGSLINPLQQAQNEINQRSQGLSQVNAKLEWKFLKDFYFTSTVGGTFTNTKTSQFYNSKTRQGAIIKNVSGTLYNTNGINGTINLDEVSSFLNENILGFRKKFNKDHSIDAIAGFTYQYNEIISTKIQALNIVPEFEYLGLYNMGSGAAANGFGQTGARTRLASYLGRVNYNLMDKYLFTVSARGDGSSKFIPSHQWGVFPSAAFAWRFSNEKFMKSLSSVLTDGKFRASYGTVGNNRGVSDFSYLLEFGAIQNSVKYMYNDATLSTGVTQYFMSNPNLTWESTKELDLGIDLTLWKDRISITADYYDKTTYDLLISRVLPSYMGYFSGSNGRYENAGTVNNRGLEFTLNTINIKTKNFMWASNFNIAYNTSTVQSFYQGYNVLTMGNSGFNPAEGWIAEVGSDISQFYGFKFLRLYQESDFTKTPSGGYVLKPGVPGFATIQNGYQLAPGDPMYADINGDGKIDNSDRTALGSPNPNFIGGFSNTLSYKNWSFNFFFKYSVGNKVLNVNSSIFETSPGKYRWGNMYESYNNRWTPENTNTDIPRLIKGGQGDVSSTSINRLSSRFIEDGSYLKLSTVSLMYSLPKKMLGILHLTDVRINLSAQNLWTLTNYTGQDPEVSTFNTYVAPRGTGYSQITNTSTYSSMTGGFDNTPYPRPIIVNTGIQIIF